MNSFHSFFSPWLEQLQHLVNHLRSLPKPSPSSQTQTQNQNLQRLVNKIITHYAEYYGAKSLLADSDVLSLFSAPWSTTLERSLHWLAGFRPTTLFHLIYTESSILFESHIIDILQGRRTGDLGDLSPAQFRGVSELQCETVREENAITDEMADWQNGACELLGVAPDIEGRVRRLVGIVKKADDLRMRTVRKVVELLTPQQAAEFVVAAAELQFGVRGWGLKEDSQRVGM